MAFRDLKRTTKYQNSSRILDPKVGSWKINSLRTWKVKFSPMKKISITKHKHILRITTKHIFNLTKLLVTASKSPKMKFFTLLKISKLGKHYPRIASLIFALESNPNITKGLESKLLNFNNFLTIPYQH